MTAVTTSLVRRILLAVVLAAVASGCGGASDTPQAGCVPAAETCNGIDDDCDGVADDGDPGGGAGCSTGLLGVCAAGVQHCQGGALVCVPTTAASAELCNGLDDDCDGADDDGDPGGGAGCSTGLLGVCAAGVQHCQGGALACVPTTAASAELCNGLDDDCDGADDDGDPGGGAGCSTGLLGICAAGVQHCQGGALACVQTTASSAELCNGLDDDCDGADDDGDPGGGAGCSTGVGVCEAGVQHCQGGALACVQTTASSAETCNGLDDDCDATVDEDFNLATDVQNCGVCGRVCTFAHALAQCVSSTCVPGACDAGFVDLDGGANGCEYACPVMPPSADVCNGLDDDCDGLADQGDPGGGLACDTGLLGVCASGVTACTGGAVTCVQDTQAGSEVCPNGLDDDCDGVVDECPYAHTIVMGGGGGWLGSPNDFTPATEEFATTTAGYTAYVTWDADHLYVGYHGAEVGTTPWRWLVVYLDVRAGTAGRSTGSTFNTQTVSFPEGFTADYEIATALDGNSNFEQITREVQAGSWVAFAPSPAVNTVLAASFNYIEMRIPLAALGDPATVGITLLVLRDSTWSEFAYGGLYQDAFISGGYGGMNVPVAKYLLADLASTRAPNDPANKRP
jgi:hypothetical protein